MNKTNLTLTILILIFSISNTQPNDTIYEKVKSIRKKVTFLNDKTHNYNPVSISGDYGHSGWSRRTGENTNLVKEEWYSKNQNIFISYINSFNIRGDLILQKITDKGSDYLYQVFLYDDKDRVVETQTYNQDFRDKNKILLSNVNLKVIRIIG